MQRQLHQRPQPVSASRRNFHGGITRLCVEIFTGKILFLFQSKVKVQT
jgi:hypothetical protein